jgi:LmbE family N-acetylglucosaminyl deacetylase
MNIDMFKKLLCGFGTLLLAERASLAAPEVPELTLEAQDRILVLAPHPDDEVLGCGGIIQQALAKGLPLRVVFLTYGDHNEWAFMVYRKHPVIAPQSVRRLGMVRHDEALAAGKILGLAPSQLTFLGYPDLGTLPIWTSHWNHQPPSLELPAK